VNVLGKRGASQPRSELVSVPVRSSAGGHSPASGTVMTSYSAAVPVAGSFLYVHMLISRRRRCDDLMILFVLWRCQ
jgi:hypothetical protein